MDVNLVGYMAGSLCTISFVPQAWKIVHSKATKGISILMHLIFFVGVSLWLIYGIIINNNPIIIFNGLTLLPTSVIIYHYFKHHKDA